MNGFKNTQEPYDPRNDSSVQAIGANPARWNERVPGPGKFEGGCEFGVHFHDAWNDGFATEEYGNVDEDGEACAYFVLDKNDPYDAQILKDEPLMYGVEVTVDSQGFVTAGLLDRDEYDTNTAYWQNKEMPEDTES